tara:strand:+ start:81 stop:854 length:774 start_codon:yes stop_codon:yes gene_type:complete
MKLILENWRQYTSVLESKKPRFSFSDIPLSVLVQHPGLVSKMTKLALNPGLINLATEVVTEVISMGTSERAAKLLDEIVKTLGGEAVAKEYFREIFGLHGIARPIIIKKVKDGIRWDLDYAANSGTRWTGAGYKKPSREQALKMALPVAIPVARPSLIAEIAALVGSKLGEEAKEQIENFGYGLTKELGWGGSEKELEEYFAQIEHESAKAEWEFKKPHQIDAYGNPTQYKPGCTYEQRAEPICEPLAALEPPPEDL